MNEKHFFIRCKSTVHVSFDVFYREDGGWAFANDWERAQNFDTYFLAQLEIIKLRHDQTRARHVRDNLSIVDDEFLVLASLEASLA